jgi:hypothetical protein
VSQPKANEPIKKFNGAAQHATSPLDMNLVDCRGNHERNVDMVCKEEEGSRLGGLGHGEF